MNHGGSNVASCRVVRLNHIARRIPEIEFSRGTENDIRWGEGRRGAANFHEKSTVPRAYIPARFYINSWAPVAALKASAKINIASILDGLLIKPDTVIAVCSRPALFLFFFFPSPPPPFNSTCARRTRIILSTGHARRQPV